ncbi:MAG: hypothetical protein DRJ05_18740 [Bacteroidetes bacterium]|nr:MAG: hypothetical protein DRJ05_18740 [Bacteroidota bacterium]
MNEKTIIETIGTISKKETLASVEDSFSNGSLVLEILYPFPGYYHTTVPDTETLSPSSIFLITKRNYTDEKIIRASSKIKKELGEKFNATPGKLTLSNVQTSCIRVKNLKGYNGLAELIELFNKEGVQMAKQRRVAPYESVINIHKSFSLSNPEDGLYFDKEEPVMCYIEIPAQLKWNAFEKMTHDIKANIDENKFDAAIGTFYRKDCLLDVVRIYDENIDNHKINTIKDKYLQAISSLKTK